MNRPADRQGAFPPVDRQRSVFVGNISYEVTEEQLRDVFSKVGTVVHLRLVNDRDTGKPKGYGFCEFTDIKSAEAAIRNLNGYELNGRKLCVSVNDKSRYELNGRNLRVDSAAGDRGEEHGREVGGVEESPYGAECDPNRAPETISRAVSSLPPEKMFQLMKQMKEIVLSNQAEAKNMLIQNPQLAYALLQAQVVMRIVDPQVAMTMLHREAPQGPTGPFHKAPSGPPSSTAFPPPAHSLGRPTMAPPPFGASPMSSGPSQFSQPPPGYGMPPPSTMGYGGPPPPMYNAPPAQGGGGNNFSSDADRDNAELLVQVLNLSEAEISALPPEDRQKVLALRNQLRNA